MIGASTTHHPKVKDRHDGPALLDLESNVLLDSGCCSKTLPHSGEAAKLGGEGPFGGGGGGWYFYFFFFQKILSIT